MASTNPYSGGGGGGGIGGKMRRRPARAAPSTPYDRPPVTPARAPAAANASNGWISKLVDPASRLLTGSASKLLSSVFRKTLPAPPPPPSSALASGSSPVEMHQEGEEEPIPQLISAETLADRQQGETLAERDPDETCAEREPGETPDEVKSVCEIEQLLAQKTFTKEQFEHLTEILRGRIVEPSLSEPAQISKGQEVEVNVPHREYVAESSRKNVMFATPASTVLIPKEEIASPMELAKAYMSSKYSKVSPTTLRLRTPAFVERKPDAPNSIVLHAPTKPPNSAAITPRPSSYLLDQVKDAYPSPRSLGRTAISRMCRSPFVKSGRFSSSGYEAKFSPNDLPMGSTPGNKLALKRGSSALYDEIGSVGPIRRIRQKLNMTTPLKESTPTPYKNFVPTHTSALNIDTNHASTSAQKHHQLSRLNQANDVSACKNGKDDAEKEPELTSIPVVPPRSTETAMKILDQLGKIVQSPKDKRTEKPVLEIEAPSPQKQDKPKVNLSKLAKYDGNISFQGNGVGGPMASAKIGNSVSDGTSSSVAIPKSTKPGFRMSVSEDFLDDDEEETNEKAETTVPVKNVFYKVEFGTSKQGKESKLPEQKGTAPPEAKAAPAATAKSDNNVLSSPPVGETSGVYKYSPPTTSPIKFNVSSAPVSSTASLDVLFKKDEKPPSPISSSGLKQQDKPEAPVFSWASGNNGAKADSRDVSRQPTTEAADSDTSGQKRKSENECKPTESASFSASPSLATEAPVKPVFAFGGSSAPSLSNGSTHSSPKFSFSAVPATAPTTQTAFTSSTTASVTSGAHVPSPAPEAPKFSFVQFGASNAASSQTLPSPSLDDLGAKASDTNAFKPVTFGNSPNVSAAGATTTEIQNAAAPPAGTLATATTSTGLFSSNVTGNSNSGITNTPTFAFGTSEKSTTPSVPTFAFGSSAMTATVTTSSPSVAPTPVSTSTSTSMATPGVTFGGSGTTGAFTFGASSQPSSSSSQSAPFTFGATSTNTNTGIFGFGASSSQNAGSSTSTPSSGSSQPSFAFGASTGSIFGSKPVQTESTGTQSNLLQSQSTGSQSSSPFASAASSPVIFGASSSGFSFSSSASTSSTSASTSQPSLFGSGSSSSPSIFGTTTFGSNPSGATFTFGQSSSTPSTSFTFGAQPSSAGFSFTASGSNSTGPGFGLSNSNANPSTVFGTVSPGSNNDQMSMEDSMVDDTNQVAAPNPPVPAFGQAASPLPAPAFQFGAPSGASPAPAFQFGAQPSQSLFQPGSSLEFNAGSQVSGSGAGDKANRRIVKVRRDKTRRK